MFYTIPHSELCDDSQVNLLLALQKQTALGVMLTWKLLEH